MSGKHGHGCLEWSCRIGRLEQILDFTVLYADCLCLQNYFSDYLHIKSHIMDEYDKNTLNYDVAGDLLLLLKLKPLLESGLVRFLPSAVMLCHEHHQKINQYMNKIDSRISSEVKILENSFAQTTRAKLNILNPKSSYLNQEYEIVVNCDEELFDHGSYVTIGTRLPRMLERKIKNNPTINKFSLTKYEIIHAHINDLLLKSISRDLSVLKHYQELFS